MSGARPIKRTRTQKEDSTIPGFVASILTMRPCDTESRVSSSYKRHPLRVSPETANSQRAMDSCKRIGLGGAQVARSGVRLAPALSRRCTPSWSVISIIVARALERNFDAGTSAARSKVDYYSQHLFASIVVHTTPPLDDSVTSLKPPPSKFRQQPIARSDSEAAIESLGARPKPSRVDRLDRFGYPAFEKALEDAFKDQEILIDGKEDRTVRIA